MAVATPPTSPTPVHDKLGSGTFPGDQPLGGTTIQVPSSPPYILNDYINGVGALAAQGAVDPGTRQHRGNTYVVAAGSVHSRVEFPNTVGPGWTRIRSGGTLPSGSVGARRAGATHVAQLATIISSGQGPTNNSANALRFAQSASGFLFQGLEITHETADGSSMNVWFDSNGATSFGRMIFDRCWIHPHPAQRWCGRAIFAAFVDDLQVWDSTLRAVQEFNVGFGDPQGICTRLGARHHYENNFIEGMGEGVLLGDQGFGAPTVDVDVQRNHFHNPIEWFRFLSDGSANPASDGVNWAMKNHFEIKVAKRVRVKGNTLENLWLAYQDHSIILGSGLFAGAQWDSSDVEVVSNLFLNIRASQLINTQRGFGGDGGGGWGNPIARLWCHNNLGRNCNGSMVFLNWGGSDVSVEHNTSVPMDAFENQKGIEFQTSVDGFPNLTVRRNVVGVNQYGILNSDGGANIGNISPAWLAEVGAGPWAENAVYGNPHYNPLAGGGVDPNIGFTRYALAVNAGLDPATGLLTANSPLRNASTEVPPRDLGVDHQQLTNDMTGAPGPPAASFTFTQTPNTLTGVLQDTSV